VLLKLAQLFALLCKLAADACERGQAGCFPVAGADEGNGVHPVGSG